MARVSRGKCVGCSPGDEPLTLTIRHSCWLLRIYKALEEWKSAVAKPITESRKGESSFLSF